MKKGGGSPRKNPSRRTNTVSQKRADVEWVIVQKARKIRELYDTTQHHRMRKLKKIAARSGIDLSRVLERYGDYPWP